MTINLSYIDFQAIERLLQDHEQEKLYLPVTVRSVLQRIAEQAREKLAEQFANQ